MGVTISRLVRTDGLRLAIVCGSMALWFLLIMSVVRSASSTITAKTNLFGGSLMQGFGIGNLATPDSLLQQMAGVSFNHPIVLALVGAVTVAYGVRACQGELLEGTLDVALAGPVKRTNYLLGYVVVMLIDTAVLMLVAVVSMLSFAALLDVPGEIAMADAAWTGFVGFATYSTFGTLGLLISVLMGRRGSAMFTTVGVLVAMFALSFAERAWDTDVIQALGPISVFHWFDPGATLSGASREWRDVLVPAAFSLAAIAAACWRFERRDL